MANLPTVLTPAGLQPQSLVALRAAVQAAVQATVPGYTGDLPASLIEDILSTDSVVLGLIDQARVETVNSLTPYGANPFLLNQLGQVYGVELGQGSNTSVLLIFTGNPGFVIAKGFTVTDGTYQYVVQDGGIIGAGGQSDQLFALASQTGTWSVPPGTVTGLVTQPPPDQNLSVVNPQAGVPGTGVETATSYRARVLQAGLAASQGMTRYLRTLLAQVPGVQPRLVAALQQAGGGWLIVCGGGDNYAVANAIYTALFDISTLVGSTLEVAGITAASPAKVSTFLNHGFAANQVVHLADVNPNNYDGTFTILTVPDEKSFTLGVPFIARQITVIAWSASVVTLTFGSAHGVTVGSTVMIAGCVPTGYNGTFVVASVPSPTTFTYALVADPGSETTLGQLLAGIANFSSLALPAWVSGGVITPNLRNIVVTITDYPDTYQIPFVNPPQQTVTMTVTWNTNSPNFVASASVAQLGAPALADYVNGIFAGLPMNLFELQAVFQQSIASILAPANLTRMVFSVAINGVGVSPESGTGIIAGDPQSYFQAAVAGITIVQG